MITLCWITMKVRFQELRRLSVGADAPGGDKFEEAPVKLIGIFEDPAWVQHVLQRIQTSNTSATHNNSTDVAEAHARPYHRKLLTDPAAYCVPLTAGSWALPGYGIASNKLVAQSPVQVSTTASGLVCNSEVFRSQASTADRKCLHTMYLVPFTTVEQAFSASGSVVLIRPSISSSAQPYAYWFDDSFFTISPMSQTLCCSHASHKSCWDQTDAVKQYVSSSSSTDGVDHGQLLSLQEIH
ncbi:TPA: hypothetical protein ACH3X1_002705 [Trebouxia sp. C0004]